MSIATCQRPPSSSQDGNRRSYHQSSNPTSWRAGEARDRIVSASAIPPARQRPSLALTTRSTTSFSIPSKSGSRLGGPVCVSSPNWCDIPKNVVQSHFMISRDPFTTMPTMPRTIRKATHSTIEEASVLPQFKTCSIRSLTFQTECGLGGSQRHSSCHVPLRAPLSEPRSLQVR
jgi:hypothetical protein